MRSCPGGHRTLDLGARRHDCRDVAAVRRAHQGGASGLVRVSSAVPRPSSGFKDCVGAFTIAGHQEGVRSFLEKRKPRLHGQVALAFRREEKIKLLSSRASPMAGQAHSAMQAPRCGKTAAVGFIVRHREGTQPNGRAEQREEGYDRLHSLVRRDRHRGHPRRRRQERVARRDVPPAPPKGVKVPNGFATTADAYRQFLARPSSIGGSKTSSRARHSRPRQSSRAGSQARQAILAAELPDALERAIIEAYDRLGEQEPEPVDVAVRASATAEDLPDASFAGQQETYLNVQGGQPCSRPASDASRRCSPTARSRTAPTRASITSRSRSRSASSAWCARTSPPRA